MVSGQGACAEPSKRGLGKRKPVFFSPLGVLREFFILLTDEKNIYINYGVQKRNRREHTSCPKPGSLPPLRATQNTGHKGILGTDPNEQESGVRAMTVGDFLQCLSLILF